MKRIKFIEYIGKTLLAAKFLNHGNALAQFKTKRPNILLIHTDQHRMD